ncbi:MAG: radical SAM protein [Clostridia bacterium]|nr:radical SAM protein [Clostridia bacterium]
MRNKNSMAPDMPTGPTIPWSDQAWKIRQRNFPMEIELVLPERTGTVSVTGRECSMNCAHCGGHYLRGMKTLDQILSRPPGEDTGNYLSYLVSGGYTKEGKIPLGKYWSELRRLKKYGRLNFHTGLVSREEAEALKPLADTVSFDFVGDDELIQKVYGADFRAEDFLRSYEYLLDTLGPKRVIPHVILGLNEGKIGTEMGTVGLLKEVGLESLVLLIFNPTRGTRFAGCSPPDLDSVGALLAEIRIALPSTPLTLGCMRPGGRYREAVDILAVHCGINKIVTPTPSLEAHARRRGLGVIWKRECCVL